MLHASKDAVGAAASTHARPQSLLKGTLRVAVDNPGWLQLLTLDKRKTLKKLQSHFGKDKISEIRFRIGEWER
jgi:predicted nucleic acid-binding Zn ribbon protein